MRIGLVDEVVAAGELMARGEALAGEMAANAPVALRLTLEAVDRGLDLPLDEGLEVEARLFGEVCATEDKAEGTQAFLAKRPARWAGR